ncbi:MAG TPA: hypothetical protein VES19_00715 [Candidatus Limnocylindrales bacterium]|nr:hypothetical protein [Candidatus Limnocylindrales bacterium]
MSPKPLETPYLDPAFVAHVVADPDPLRRNAAITRGYHALSEAVAAILGHDHANWLTFGQWASAEARESIDGTGVPAVVRPFFGDEIMRAVADGNAAIFADVAPPFIRFVTIYSDTRERTDAASRQRAREALLATPQIAASEDLVRAFGAYADAVELLAAGDPDPARRAERMLVANASVGAHEQHVADPFVRAAIPGRWISAVVATSHMGLRVPEGVLELQHDVPLPGYLGGAQFPPGLDRLDDPEALALAVRFGQDPDSAEGSDALDWESYDERMGFIFTLLRAYQGDPALFELPPGTP